MRVSAFQRSYSTTTSHTSTDNILSAQHLPLADHIIILDEKGNIAEQGTWEDLRNEAGYISKVVLKEKGDGENKPRDRAEAKDTIQMVPEELDSSIQDITRKTGDFTLYSTSLPYTRGRWAGDRIQKYLTIGRLLLQRHRVCSPHPPRGLSNALRHLNGFDSVLASLDGGG